MVSKFYGVVGYVTQSETSPGVWDDTAVERTYRGDILQNTRRWQQVEKVNDDLTVSNKISIMADPYSYANLANIKYVNWLGTNWKITDIEILRPRLILTIGGVYNGPTP